MKSWHLAWHLVEIELPATVIRNRRLTRDGRCDSNVIPNDIDTTAELLTDSRLSHRSYAGFLPHQNEPDRYCWYYPYP